MTQIHRFPFIETSSLPSYNICQRSRCLRDALEGTHYCAGHQPKPKAPDSAWAGMKVVYIIGAAGDEFVKIGYATDLSARLVNMQVGSARELLVHCVLEGGVKVESILHLEMQAHHVRGEWFKAEPVKALCEKLQKCRHTRMRLKIESVISEWSDAGHPWDGRGVAQRRKRPGFTIRT